MFKLCDNTVKTIKLQTPPEPRSITITSRYRVYLHQVGFFNVGNVSNNIFFWWHAWYYSSLERASFLLRIITNLLTEWDGWMEKYLAWGHGIQTKHRQVCMLWPRSKYFPIRPYLTQSIGILWYHHFCEWEMSKRCLWILDECFKCAHILIMSEEMMYAGLACFGLSGPSAPLKNCVSAVAQSYKIN